MAPDVRPWNWLTTEKHHLAIPPDELHRRLNAEVFERIRRLGWLPLAIALERTISCWYWLPPERAWWVCVNWIGAACALLALYLHATLYRDGRKDANLWVSITASILLLSVTVNSLGYGVFYPTESTAFVLLITAVTIYSPWLMLINCLVAFACRLSLALTVGDEYALYYLIIRIMVFAPVMVLIVYSRRHIQQKIENLAWVNDLRSKELSQLVIQMSREVEDRLSVEKELKTKEQELRALSRKLLTLQETERSRISRELHDQLGQDFTAVSFSLELLRRELPDDYSTAVDETIRLVSQSIDHVRGLAMELRPSLLDHLGLEAALRWNADRIRSHTGVDVTFITENEGQRFPASVEAACFRIAQEATTNAVRHGSAHSLVIRHIVNDESLTVSIEDDGKGFVYPPTGSKGFSTGLGLLGMKERAEDNGGVLTIKSQPGHGTTVRVIFSQSKNISLNEVGAA